MSGTKEITISGTVEVKDGLRLAVELTEWPDGTPMLVIHYRSRTPNGGWVDAAHQLAFPHRLADQVAAILIAHRETDSEGHAKEA